MSTLIHKRSSSSKSIYQDLLGDRWEQLSPVLQRFHGAASKRFYAKGKFDLITRQDFFSLLIVQALGFPKPKKNIPVELEIVRKNELEIWTRQFDKNKIVSIQEPDSESSLVEKFGPFQCHFQLVVNRDKLFYNQTAFKLKLGLFLIKWPNWLQPQIKAFEKASTDDVTIVAHVEFHFPIFGQLLAYTGSIQVE